MNRREWIQHIVVIGTGLAVAGVLFYLAYFGRWSK